jgi:hypothetical protein
MLHIMLPMLLRKEKSRQVVSAVSILENIRATLQIPASYRSSLYQWNYNLYRRFPLYLAIEKQMIFDQMTVSRCKYMLIVLYYRGTHANMSHHIFNMCTTTIHL